jgi:hypothetical protein
MKEKRVTVWLMLFVFGLCSLCTLAGAKDTGKTTGFNTYHTPAEMNRMLKDLAGTNSKIAELHKIAVSPGGNEVYVLELGPEKGKKKTLPSIFVAANMEGTVPISTEAALYLCRLLVEKPEMRKDKTWYILPAGNPDAAWNFFKKPKKKDPRNARRYNDDMDDREDEDGTDDLDGNGIITTMRVKDLQGSWIPVPGEPRLMKRADWTKGEKGIYKLYSEGIDNDKDGQYNEDGPGGVNVGINFPHLFKPFTKTGGKWPGSEEEVYNLFKFIFERPEIAMTICFGETNFCKTPPRGGRKGTADYSKIKVPERIAKQFGFDHKKTYSMDEIMEKAKQMAPPGFELTESMVASFLGLGAAVNPQAGDLKFYNKISEEFKEFLKKNKMDAKRQEPARAKDGSFELWAYYHLGLPSFTMDFWSLPEVKEKKKDLLLTPEKLENMSKDDFLALGEEKLDAFLKSSGAPGNIKAKMLLNMVKNGMMTTKKMAQMMRQMPKPKSKEGADPREKALLNFSDKQLDGKGFVEWKSFKHPTLGTVEIGGAVPFTDNTPPAEQLEGLLKGQVPWVFELTKKLPRIKLAKTETRALGAGVYRIKAWVENTGMLPYPTSMGARNDRIGPVVVTLKGNNVKILEGKKRSLVKSIGGFGTRMVQWLVLAEQPVNLTVAAQSPNAWKDAKTVSLGGAK